MPYKDKEQQKQAQHESYLRNKEEVKERNRKRRKERKEWFYEYLSDKSCINCGEVENVCLDHHHVNPEEKHDGIGHMLTELRSIESILKEIDKCVIICSNCHRKLHAGLITI